MYRWGDRDWFGHYIHGVFPKKSKALDEAEAEKKRRGTTKYYPEVLEMDLNDPSYKKIILELEMNPNWNPSQKG